MWLEFVAFVILLWVLVVVLRGGHQNPNRNKNLVDFPPGETLLPSLPWDFCGWTFANPWWTKLQDLKQKYGNIVSVNLGDSDMVVLHGHKLIKETLSDGKFNYRPPEKEGRILYRPPGRGITHATGKHWSEQRKFVLKNFRDLGVGKQSLESMVHEELVELVSIIKKTPQVPLNIHSQLSLAVLNSLWHLIAGDRHASLECSNLLRFERNLNLLTKETKHGFLGDLSTSPVQNWVDKLLAITGQKNVKEADKQLRTLLRTELRQHECTIQDDNPRDFMDLYIREIIDTEDKDSSFHKEIGEENAVQTILDLLVGAIEPTTNSINWALYFLSRTPAVQKKIQDEIDTVIGHFHPSSVNNRMKMPYTEAVILETLRLSSIATYPVGLPRTTTENTSFHNFKIPKGTTIVGNLYDLHHDEQTWKDPLAFRPERFLKSNGCEIDKNHPPLFPFSLGKRVCPGETMAKDVMFLFITTIFQRFHLFPPSQTKETISMQTSSGVFKMNGLRNETLSRFKVVFEDRLEFLDRVTLDEHDK